MRQTRCNKATSAHAPPLLDKTQGRPREERYRTGNPDWRLSSGSHPLNHSLTDSPPPGVRNLCQSIQRGADSDIQRAPNRTGADCGGERRREQHLGALVVPPLRGADQGGGACSRAGRAVRPPREEQPGRVGPPLHGREVHGRPPVEVSRVHVGAPALQELPDRPPLPPHGREVELAPLQLALGRRKLHPDLEGPAEQPLVVAALERELDPCVGVGMPSLPPPAQ
mmetsp:Transcript_42947/g.107475  ORF Transcript_42947/g.107475 Transcript_42947/m.107475 type:complete len:225 (-) Transcript_42947:646-1320(-)